MPRLCLDTPIPSIASLMSMFGPLMTYPPSLPSFQLPNFELPPFPGMPDFEFPPFPGIPKFSDAMLSFLGLPSPLFSTMHLPNLEFVTVAIHLQAFQLHTTIMNMIKPMLSFLGRSLSSFLPDIPGLPGFTLVDLISGEVKAMVAALKSAIMAGIKLPLVPSPLFGTLKAVAIEVPHTLMILTSNYLQTVINLLIGLIKAVTDKLKISAMAALPSFPSFDSVVSALKATVKAMAGSLTLPDFTLTIPKFPGFDGIEIPKIPSLPGMPGMPSLNFSSLLAGLTFPGFPAMPSIPDPLIPTFNLPDINIALGVSMLMNHLSTCLLTPIMDFIQKTLKRFIGFEFPLICINL